jgi:hypothetical protein
MGDVELPNDRGKSHCPMMNLGRMQVFSHHEYGPPKELVESTLWDSVKRALPLAEVDEEVG